MSRHWIPSTCLHQDPTDLPIDGDLWLRDEHVSGFSRFHLGRLASSGKEVTCEEERLLCKELYLYLQGQQASLIDENAAYWEGRHPPEPIFSSRDSFDAWTKLPCFLRLKQEEVEGTFQQFCRDVPLLEVSEVLKRLQAVMGERKVWRIFVAWKALSGVGKKQQRKKRKLCSNTLQKVFSSSVDTLYPLRSLIGYRPPWVAFRLNGMYEDFFLVLWEDQTVTWEPSFLCHGAYEDKLQAMAAWIKLHNWLLHVPSQEDPLPENLEKQLRELDEESRERSCSFHFVPGKSMEAGFHSAEECSWKRELQEAKNYVRVHVWKSLVEAQVTLVAHLRDAPPGRENKRMQLKCLESRNQRQVFYLWGAEEGTSFFPEELSSIFIRFTQ